MGHQRELGPPLMDGGGDVPSLKHHDSTNYTKAPRPLALRWKGSSDPAVYRA